LYAAQRTAEVLGISVPSVKKLIGTGDLGQVLHSGRSQLVAAQVVDSLATRPRMTPTLMESVVGMVGSLLVLRPAERRPSPTPDRTWYGTDANARGTVEHDLAVYRWYPFAPHTRELISQRIEEQGFQPLVLSVGGYNAECRNGTQLVEQDGLYGFEVQPATEWSTTAEQHWMPLPGGGPWLWWPQPPRPAQTGERA